MFELDTPSVKLKLLRTLWVVMAVARKIRSPHLRRPSGSVIEATISVNLLKPSCSEIINSLNVTLLLKTAQTFAS